LRGFAGGRVSAALAKGAMARANRSAAVDTHFATNTGAFIFSPRKLARPLKSASYSDKNGARMIPTEAKSG
jgi:hypothetical protein